MNEQDTWDAFFGLAAAGYDTGETTMAQPEDVADYAAKTADAMMAELGKRIETRAAELERERVKAYRAGLLEAAAHCEAYAAVVADDPDDLDASGPHEVHVSVARHLARELREVADRCVRGVRLDTGEVVSERKLELDDLQEPLFGDTNVVAFDGKKKRGR